MDINEIKKILNQLYNEFENQPLPTFASLSEQSWNDGFRQGRLTAMEKVVVAITGEDGDKLKDNESTSQ